jgi:2-polyprenyl-6-methoxyphenol hydroxylase-like FAD-dependent oxidoreductase
MAIGKQAIVIGSSMTGMLAARVLADHFEQVTVIERDRLPDGAELRNGVPQGRHLHILLAQGAEIMEDLFPGLNDELTAAGVPHVRLGWDSIYLTVGGWLPRFDSGIYTRAPSRALLDWTVRQRLMQNPRVNFLEERQVTGLVATPDNSSVTGIHLKRRGTDEEETLSADLVVDASGRESHAPEWLQNLGYDAPPESHVNAFLGYATRWYERPNDPTIDWRAVVIGSRPPHVRRGGAILEVEGGRWVVTLAGVNKDYPPTDEAGFLEFARQCISPMIYDAIKDAKPISSIFGYQRTENRWRHYERLSRLPGRFVVLGDAACAFNPIYGQGLSVCAMAARTLDACLRENGDLIELPLRFQKRLAAMIKNVWLMATGEDLRYPATEGKRPNAIVRLTQKYVDRVQRVMRNSNELAIAFLEVVNLRKPPTALFRPKLVLKVLRGEQNKEAGATLQPLPALQVQRDAVTREEL